MQRKAAVATDVSVKGFSMGGCWMLIDIDKKIKMRT